MAKNITEKFKYFDRKIKKTEKLTNFWFTMKFYILHIINKCHVNFFFLYNLFHKGLDYYLLYYIMVVLLY